MIPYLENTVFWGNTLIKYIYFVLIIIVSLVASKIIRFIFKKYFNRISKKTETKIDDLLFDALGRPLTLTIFFIGLFIALKLLVFSTLVDNIINKTFIVVIIFLITFGISKLVHSAIEVYWRPKVTDTKSRIDDNLIPVIKSLSSWVVWIIGIIFLLNNLGVNVTSLMAGLGIGGLAIAFALQNVFVDLFASISIYLDRPFHVGDYIVTGNDSGTVKKIGLKTTRITTLQGEELIISNKELTESRVKNYKKMKKRRVSFEFGVEYGTSSAKLKKIPLIIKKIVDKDSNVDFERCHFTDFGDSSLKFDAVMYIKNRDYILYKDVQHKVNLNIVEEFTKEKISMAFPTRTIVMKK